LPQAGRRELTCGGRRHPRSPPWKARHFEDREPALFCAVFRRLSVLLCDV